MTNKAELLLNLMHEPGAPISNWVQILNAIDAAFKDSESSEQRGSLLEAFKTTMDFVEENLDIDQENMDALKKNRGEHYKRLLIQEVLIGETIDIKALFKTTEREIEAGRLEREDNIRKLAVEGMTGHYGSYPKVYMVVDGSLAHLKFAEEPKIEPKKGLRGALGRLFGK